MAAMEIDEDEDEIDEIDEEPYNIAPSTFIKKIAELNGVDLKDLIKKNSKTSNKGKIREFVIRSLFEHSSPTTQCSGFIGKCPSDSPPCICWICGEKITNPDGTNKLGPECEHKIPVMAANLILGGLYTPQLRDDANELETLDTIGAAEETDDIYTGRDLDIVFAKKTMDRLTNEYAWAHKICNGHKKDKLYIKNNGDFDDDKIINTLTLIWNSNEFIQAFKSDINKRLTKNDWIQERLLSMKDSLKQIQQEIKDQYDRGVNLSLLANTASVMHNLINDQKHQLFNEELLQTTVQITPATAIELNIKLPTEEELLEVSERIPNLIVKVYMQRTAKMLKMNELRIIHQEDINKLFDNNNIKRDYVIKILEFIPKFIEFFNYYKQHNDNKTLKILNASYTEIFYLKYYLASINEVNKWSIEKNTYINTRDSSKYKIEFLNMFNTIPRDAVKNPNYDKYKTIFFTKDEIDILDNFKIITQGGKKRKQNKYKKKNKKSKKNINKKNSKKINKKKSKKKQKKNNINKRKSIKK